MNFFIIQKVIFLINIEIIAGNSLILYSEHLKNSLIILKFLNFLLR